MYRHGLGGILYLFRQLILIPLNEWRNIGQSVPDPNFHTRKRFGYVNQQFGRQSDPTQTPPSGDAPSQSDDVKLELPPEVPRSSWARSGMVRFFNLIMTLAIICVVGFIGLIWYSDKSFDETGPLREEATIEIRRGATFTSIIPDLEAKNIIPQQGPLRIFIRGVRSANKTSALKAGEFAIQPGMSMRQVMNHLTEGRSIQHTVTLPEGWTSYQIMERIQFSEILEGDLPPIPAEGSLLPSTYSFLRGSTRTQAVEHMQEAQSKALAEIWAGRDEGLPLQTPQELVILASIVEKETGVAEERAHVASVFINRLRKGMKLESDPTIIYGIFGGKGKPKDRPIFRSDIRRATPYNTYVIPALPPAPIANPGLEAMKAVAHPIQSEDLFFVADGSGGHAFAATLKQHNTNVAKWRRFEAERKRQAKKAAKEAAQKAKDLRQSN